MERDEYGMTPSEAAAQSEAEAADAAGYAEWQTAEIAETSAAQEASYGRIVSVGE